MVGALRLNRGSQEETSRASGEQIVLVNPRRLLLLIHGRPGVTARDLASGMDYPVPSIMWVIRMLAREGIVEFGGTESADSELSLNDILLATALRRAAVAGLELDLPLAK
jgi:hypothetical protein